MKVMKKNSDSPFSFSFVYKDSKDPYKELPTHIHDFHEIIYVHKGKGTFFINNTVYEMGRGDVFIVPNDTIHYTAPDNDDLIMSSVIFFSPALIQTTSIDENFSYLSIIEKIKRNKHYKLSLPDKNQSIMEDYLHAIQIELSEKQLGSIHAAILTTHQVLLFLSRFSIKQSEHEFRETDFSSYWINEIFTYMDRNLQGNLSLSLLAERAHVSPAHLSRVFKQITGMGFNVYLNKRRTFRAKELLCSTDYPIVYIAELSGFESTPHFYRTFKKYAGATPAKYRKSKTDPGTGTI
ncbi:AraC family transcriptional regulator [Sediminibacillus massiliensis]|uniref:AraC family transcriptional regulator n=1 Tax=Sediminibacillus massiliensis TaxID=1926277 RepID=UPI0009884871|nr:AraC family transcriptional regulator [Sediminibacillus massiliensis]